MATTPSHPRRAAKRPTASQKLAIFGGPPTVPSSSNAIFHWPIITDEDEAAALDVLRRGTMSQSDITIQFEREFAAWQGTRHALGFCNGTMALQAAMFACNLGVGDEMISPAMTYWASTLQAFSLGATVVFADIDAESLCIGPRDIEHRITPQTKAIMVVHYLARPCDMDAIMDIARRHQLKVIEDVSHAQGGLYRGRKLGTFGDVAAMSLMSGKSLAIGEAGMLVTDDREAYERAIAWGHYERFNEKNVQSPALLPFAGLPMGGVKGRMHQISAAVGRVQLKYYDERCTEIRRAINYFWDLLDDVPGLRANRVDERTGSNMAGWYAGRSHYLPEELGGLSAPRFAEAVRAEGSLCSAGCNLPLHTHPLLNECDIYGDGQPTRLVHAQREVRQLAGTLPITERLNSRVVATPWFKHFEPEIIEEHARAYRKVAANAHSLLKGDADETASQGTAGLTLGSAR